MNHPVFFVRCLALSLLLSFPLRAPGAEANASSSPAGKNEETNSQEVLRSYLQIQEQLHATQLAIERTRQEADATAAQTAKTLGDRLQSVEQALAAQRAHELDVMQSSNHAMQSSNRVMVIVAGAFATIGFMAMVLMAYFLWRTINRLAEISAALPAVVRRLEPGPYVPALGAGETNLVTVGPAEQANQRLLGAIDRLEKRIYELEHAAQPALKEGPSSGNGLHPADDGGANGAAAPGESAPAQAASLNPGPVAALLARGQSLLDSDQAEGALACFEEALALEPGCPEALVKKGAAFEKLRKLDEAIACYDRAISADSSLTIAYLHKGGLFNRMERFSEALECYEQALRTQEKRNS